MKKIEKDVLNNILLIIFSFFYFLYIVPEIDVFKNRLLLVVGIWITIGGVWGQIVGFKPLGSRGILFFLSFKNIKHDNNATIFVGIMCIISGVIFGK